jgi:hypothetical protein
MATTPRCKLRTVLLLAAFAACFGCNPLLFPLFLQGESREDATVKRLASKDKKEVKVAFVTTAALSARQELIGVPRDLTQKVVQQLRKLSQVNEDKVTVIEPRKVEQYLAAHPGWRDMDESELAEELQTALKADYVVNVEIASMSLTPPGNIGLFKAQAELHVILINANDKADRRETDIRETYPDEIESVKIADHDTNIGNFRSEFLDVLAKDVAYCFCDHPTINHMDKSRKGFAD